MDIQTRIGQRIKALRVAKDLTQEAVAFNADIDRTFMNHIENGKRNISIATLEKVICQGLQMSFPDFFNDDSFKSKKGKK
jgi:transcriptional regulator with XRE-family HTH domain